MFSTPGICRDPHEVCPDCGYGQEIDEYGPLAGHGCPNPAGSLGWVVGSTVHARGVQARVIRVRHNLTLPPVTDLLYGAGRSMWGVRVCEIAPVSREQKGEAA